MTQQEITDYIFLESGDLSADIAIVFGINRFWRAVDKALELYRNGSVKKFIFTGGANKHSGTIEGPAMALYAEDHDMPMDAFLIEDKGSNTLENVVNSRALLDETVTTVVGVCMSFHARRVAMTLKKQFPSAVIKIAPYDCLGITKDNWFDTEKGRERVQGELNRIEEYLAKGDLAEL